MLFDINQITLNFSLKLTGNEILVGLVDVNVDEDGDDDDDDDDGDVDDADVDPCSVDPSSILWRYLILELSEKKPETVDKAKLRVIKSIHIIIRTWNWELHKTTRLTKTAKSFPPGCAYSCLLSTPGTAVAET